MRLLVEKPLYGGDCLAHLSALDGKMGKAVFIPLTLPGESVAAHPTEDKRSFLKAEVDEILTPSPLRVAPQCPHFGACGGCHYQHADYFTQLSLKQQILRETLTRAGVALPAAIGLLAGKPWEYRNRIRLALSQKGELGYRGRRSHAIIPIRECPIAAPLLMKTATQFAHFIAENPSPAAISEIELFTDRDESQILFTAFCEKPPANGAQDWLRSLKSAFPQQITGIRLQLAGNGPQSDIFAADGQASLTYKTDGFAYRVDHGAFFQVNRWLVDQFVSLVTGGHGGKTAWDLYAGVGLFARQIAANFECVFAVESAPASVGALAHNLAATTGQARPSFTLDFLRRNREQREPRPDLIVLDPPRAGLGDETTTLLNAIQAPAMVYASCDPATLARDLRALTQERYRIDRVTMVDMFPQTFHIEAVVQLSRS